MARLLIQPGSPGAREIQLMPGTNSLGRGMANDFRLDDPSVSGSHCEILISNGSVIVKDLGSTNGTYVNRLPVQEAALQPGQTLHLGGVEMLLQADAGAPALGIARATAQLLPPQGGVPESPALGIARVTSRAPSHAPPPLPPPVAAPAAPGSQYCKHHPKTLGRFLCDQCHHLFCELCVTSRNVGGAHKKFCRHCGAELTAVQVQIQRTARPGFYSLLPGAFAYPFRGAGVLVLIVGMILFAALRFLSTGSSGMGLFRYVRLGLIAQVFAGGYLFSYLQTIIHSTISEDKEMPDLPGMSNFLDDILMPFLRLLGVSLVSFAPLIGIAAWYVSQDESPPPIALIPAGIFGCLYFPMAFLAVATLDSVAAANPLVVVPSIFKVPLEYLVTVVLLAAVFGARALGDLIVGMFFGAGTMLTHSMGVLFAMFGIRVFWSFVSLYLLTVTMRILGLLYLTKKSKFGWHGR